MSDNTAHETEAPLTFAEQRSITLINGAFDIGHAALRASVLIAGFYFTSEAIADLAGKDTYASFFVKWLTSEETSGKSSYSWAAFGIVCAVWAVAERKLRQRKTAQLAGRIEGLELKLDPHRTGSGLTPQGKTPKTDSRNLRRVT